jgi:hypothetical protein
VERGLMVKQIPTATFPGKNAEPQTTTPLVDQRLRITPEWRRWTEFVDITIRRFAGLFTFLKLEDTPDSYSGQTGKSVRVNAGETALEFYTPTTGTGDVVGPASAVDNRIARFDGTTGKLIQNSGASIDDAGNLSATNFSGTSSGANTGDQTITLTGDVTGSGTGSFAVAIGALKVLTSMVANAAITLGKIANASGNSKLLGSGATGSGASYSEISLGTNLSMSGTTLNAAGGTAASTTEVLTGTDTAKFATPDAIAALWEQGANAASSGTVSLGEGGFFHITGTTTIADIDFATDKAGRMAWVAFDGILTLTHNASTLILPTAANITTTAGDRAVFVSEGSDVVRCLGYTRADGTALVASDATLSTSDITTNNVSIAKHGFAPKAPNDATKFLDGTGGYSVPGGTGGSGGYVPAAVSLLPWYPPSSAGSLDDEFASGSTIDTGRWTWVNQGTRTAPVARSFVTLTAVSAGTGDVWSHVVQAAPATPWTVVAQLGLNMSIKSNFLYGGLIVRDSATGKFTAFKFDNTGVEVDNWTNPTTFSANIKSVAYGTYPNLGGPGPLLFLKVQDDGTNLIFSWSFDGALYQVFQSVGRTSFLANPNQVGLGIGTNIASGTAWLDVDFFRRTQ